MIASSTLIRIALAGALGLAACERSNHQTFQGWVEADLVFVSPDDPGRVEQLGVREGDAVTVGSPLFAVDEDLQRADVAAAAAAAAEARARLARLEAQQQRPAEVAVLEAQQERSEAMLALSTAEFERQKALAEKGYTPKSQFDTAQANYNRDRAVLEEIRRQIVVARLASRDEDIAAARQALAMAEARQKSAETKLARRRVASPVAGTVKQIYFRPGEMVPVGRPVLALLPPANIKVRFFVPEPSLPKVGLGNTVQVHCDGCNGDLPARIDFIAQTAEFTPPVVYTLEERAKLVFLVEARPKEPERLRVGQPVRVLLVGVEAKR
jgi:HlyD family secretion protein